MRKKLIAVALSTVMAMSLFTACGSSEGEQETTTKKAVETTKEAVETTTPAQDETETTGEEEPETKRVTDKEEAITKDPLVSEDFEGDMAGVVAVSRKDEDPNTGKAAVPVVPTAEDAVAAGKTLLTTESYNGGTALDLDGTYGAKVNFTAVDSQSYTISFWINPARFSEFTPLAVLGNDLLEANGTCSWLSVTKTTWNETVGCPTIWSRSLSKSRELGLEDGAVWPWYIEKYFFAYTEGADLQKDTWYHIVITVNGDIPGEDPVTGEAVPGTVLGTTYVNGQFFGEGPVAMNCMTADSEMFLGINPWDLMQKAKYDNIQIYDYALTDGQVFGLYNAQK